MDDYIFYVVAFILGLFVAATEIISRYRDEPLKAIDNRYGFSYLLLNGILSSVALLVLFLTGRIPPTDPLQKLLGALAAGFGAMVILRIKFFTIKSEGGEEISIGPGSVLDALVNYIDRQIDRSRAIERTELIKEVMEGIDFDKVKFYASTLILGSMQNLSAKDEEELGTGIKNIKESPVSPQEKSYALGFLMLDFMGENFLKEVFSEQAIRNRFKTTPTTKKNSSDQ